MDQLTPAIGTRLQHTQQEPKVIVGYRVCHLSYFIYLPRH
jgi:hypothetical protein